MPAAALEKENESKQNGRSWLSDSEDGRSLGPPTALLASQRALRLSFLPAPCGRPEYPAALLALFYEMTLRHEPGIFYD